jgi:hypothetical protein
MSIAVKQIIVVYQYACELEILPIFPYFHLQISAGSHPAVNQVRTTHKCPQVPTVPSSAHQCPPSAQQCPPVPSSAHQCPPVPTSAHLCPPVPISAHQCPPVPTSAHQCPPVPNNAHPCPPVPSSANQYIDPAPPCMTTARGMTMTIRTSAHNFTIRSSTSSFKY